MQGLHSYPFQLLQSNLTEMPDEQTTQDFIYVSVHPEAAFRALSEEERTQYRENETTRLLSALSIESSLSRVTQIDPSIGDEAKARALLAIGLSWLRLCCISDSGLERLGSACSDYRSGARYCITLGLTACAYIAPTASEGLVSAIKNQSGDDRRLLPLIGYSLNDTIVVFDRIRENRGKGLVILN